MASKSKRPAQGQKDIMGRVRGNEFAIEMPMDP
jgi:hypothetical protein